MKNKSIISISRNKMHEFLQAASRRPERHARGAGRRAGPGPSAISSMGSWMRTATGGDGKSAGEGSHSRNGTATRGTAGAAAACSQRDMNAPRDERVSTRSTCGDERGETLRFINTLAFVPENYFKTTFKPPREREATPTRAGSAGAGGAA